MGGVARFALLIGLVGRLLDPFDLPENSNKERYLATRLSLPFGLMSCLLTMEIGWIKFSPIFENPW